MIILPKKIHLTAMRKHWKVSYVQSSGKLIIVEHPHHELALYGKNYSKTAALKLITQWLRLKAHQHFEKVIKKLNRRVKANYKKFAVRSHEAQWGSFSVNKIIYLNYKLIFLPPTLVAYVIYHELCHSHVFSHDEKFWKDLEKYDPHWRRHRKELDGADCHIPKWVKF